MSCNRCIQVCPTGIDIRRGLQMECIACTACIDACDVVMEKTKRPPGLIRYTSAAELAGKPKRVLSVRVVSLALLLLAVVAGFSLTLFQKEFLDMNILRAGGEPYATMIIGSQQMVTNRFRFEASNQTGKAQKVTIALGKNAGADELIAPMNPVVMEDSATIRAEFFIRFPANSLQSGSRKLQILLQSEEQPKTVEVTLVGPGA